MLSCTIPAFKCSDSLVFIHDLIEIFALPFRFQNIEVWAPRSICYILWVCTCIEARFLWTFFCSPLCLARQCRERRIARVYFEFVTTTAHAQSALKRPVWLRPDLAFAGGYMRIEWDRHQCRNEVNRMDLVLYVHTVTLKCN